MYTVIKKGGDTPLVGGSPLEKAVLVITCQAGLEALVKKDTEKHGGKILSVTDRLIRVAADEAVIYNLLLWSRYSNRIYLELSCQTVTDFDALFEQTKNISWRKHILRDSVIVTEAMSHKSVLTHIPTLQSIMKKAIVTTLTENSGSGKLYERQGGNELHVQLFLLEDTAHIALDITWMPLHKRGYRREAWEAPIKENLAAALVSIAAWRYKTPLYDPFCGSGTIAIEAAMLARNIAPWLQRTFAVEQHPYFERSIFDRVKNEAKKKSYPSGEYAIFASDIDQEVLEKAVWNAQRAGVGKDIVFLERDFLSREDTLPEKLHAHIQNGENYAIVSNPPYGERLDSPLLKELYAEFAEIFKQPNISGGVITSSKIWDQYIDRKDWKDRKLYNGGKEARYFTKKIP